ARPLSRLLLPWARPFSDPAPLLCPGTNRTYLSWLRSGPAYLQKARPLSPEAPSFQTWFRPSRQGPGPIPHP
ncbi:hypothetical protein P7K49_033666, partial [Saguinus oedipus]